MVGKRTLLGQYVLSYLAILFIPLFALAVIIYQGMIGNLKRDLDARSMAELQRIVMSIEGDLWDLKRVTTQIVSDPQLTRHKFASSEVSQLEAMTVLKRYANYNQVEQILIYYKGDDAIYSTNGMASVRAAVDSSYMKGAWTYERLYEALNTPANAYLDVGAPNGAPPTRWYQYICPMISSTGTEYGKVVFTVRANLFGRYLSTGTSSPASYFIFDERSHVFYQQNQHDLSAEKIAGMIRTERARAAGTDHVYETRGDGDDLLVVSTARPDAGWTYLMVLSSRQHYEVYTRSISVALGIYMAVLAAVLLLSYAMSKRNTNRIKKLLDFMTDRFSFAATSEVQQDELGLLRLVMESAANRVTDLEEKLDWMEARSTNEVLMRFLSGKDDGTDDIPRSELFERSQLGTNFTEGYVLLISFVEKPNMPREAMLFYLKEAAQFPETELCLVDMTPAQSIAVIVMTNAKAAQHRKDVLAKLTDLLVGKIGGKVVVTVGDAYADPNELPTSYQEALAAYHEQAATDVDREYLDGDAQRPETPPSWYPDAQLKLLNKHILAGDEARIDRTVEELKRMVFRDLPAGSQRRSALFEIFNTLIRLSYKLGVSMNHAQTDALLLCESEKRFAAQTSAFCRQIARELERARDLEHVQLRRSILAYAKENFADANVSLVSIGLHFNVSLSYLSKLFKEETGETFTDYMTRLRIDRCKELLAHTDKPVKDIVQEIGYLDASNFIRKFRTLENMTPGKYRERMREGDVQG